MSDKIIKECYSTIFKEVINSIKEDPMLQSILTHAQIESLEEKWKKNLESRGIHNEHHSGMAPYFEMGHPYSVMRNQMHYKSQSHGMLALNMDENLGQNRLPYSLLGQRQPDLFPVSGSFRGIQQKPDHYFSIGAIESGKDNIAIPTASKEAPKEAPKDSIYMEDEDQKLHVPIPNRLGDQFKLASEASAFRSALSKPQSDSKQGGAQSSFAQSLPENEAMQKKEENKPMQIQFEFNLGDTDQQEKAPDANDNHRQPQPMMQEEDDEDDDDDLFGDNSEKSGPAHKDDAKMLDKRVSEIDNQDDDDLFGDEKPEKKLVTTSNGQTAATKAPQNDNVPSTRQQNQHQSEMDQRIEVALRKEVPALPEEGSQASHTQEKSVEEQLNSDDDLSDSEVFDTGNNILLGYYVKSKRKKDKRKIQFKHCILRVNNKEYLIQNAKGEFKWAAGDRGR